MQGLNLILVDPKVGMINAWKKHFGDLGSVSFIQGRFESVTTYDCMVSPANSFGLMDGGVDLAISQYFGWELMNQVQSRIQREFMGEQPVGTALIVPTGHPDHPWLAHAPTMRVPMDIRGTDHVYMAFRAVLVSVLTANSTGAQIESVLCPGLGTGYGKMNYDEAARQMRAAYDSIPTEESELNWAAAAKRQKLVGVRPVPPQARGLAVDLEDWTEWDRAAFSLATILGITNNQSFHDYKAVVWDHSSPLRQQLLQMLKDLETAGFLESRTSVELEYRFIAPLSANTTTAGS